VFALHGNGLCITLKLTVLRFVPALVAVWLGAAVAAAGAGVPAGKHSRQYQHCQFLVQNISCQLL
jgi:hypothetical protein